jgi:hypothetical protein
MQETIEFRIPETYAKEFLDATDGVCIGGSVRKVEIPLSDPLFARIGTLDRAFQAKGKAFFTAWIPHRRYMVAELQSAKCFQVLVKRVLEPAGEQCGTLYDESSACEYCGAGEQQISDLVLEARHLPKQSHLGIAKTIAGEIVVSQAFVELFQGSKLKGAEFGPVRQRRNPALTVPGWYQLLVKSRSLIIVAPTRAGVTPFDDGSQQLLNQAEILDQLNINGSWCDRKGEYRCPLGHTIGLGLLSELSVENDEGEWDIAWTKQRVGVRRGLLRPEPLLVISRRFWEILVDQGLKGMAFEIVHLIPAGRTISE